MADLKDLKRQLEALTAGEKGQLVPMLEEAWGLKSGGGYAGSMGLLPLLFPWTDGIQTREPDVDVVLDAAGPDKLSVVRYVRDVLKLPLPDAKRLVDRAPVLLWEMMEKTDGKALAAKLRALGATVTVRER